MSEQQSKRKCCPYIKNFFKTISTGGHTHGLFFEGKQQYLTVFSGIVTLFGAMIVLGISIKIIVDISQQTHQESKIDYPHFDLSSYNLNLLKFLDNTDFKFEIKAMSYEAMLPTNLDCDNFNVTLHYVLTLDGNTPTQMNITCREQFGNLYYTIDRDPRMEDHIIINDEFFRLYLSYVGDEFLINGTKLYFLYQGKSYFFTGTNLDNSQFTSLDLELGKFYKTQIAPLIDKTMPSPWQIDIFGISYDSRLLFTFGEPYFESDVPSFNAKQLLIYFKYNNDNNPFTQITTTSQTLLTGLEKIGGQMKIIGICSFILFIYNKFRFERHLKRKYCQILNEHGMTVPNEEQQPFTRQFSYEMMMDLVIQYRKDKQKEKESQLMTAGNIFDSVVVKDNVGSLNDIPTSSGELHNDQIIIQSQKQKVEDNPFNDDDDKKDDSEIKQ